MTVASINEVKYLLSREEVLEGCKALGIIGAAAQTIAASGAAHRHGARTATAKAAAVRWVEDNEAAKWALQDGGIRKVCVSLLAWSVCIADAPGTGGWRGLTGDGTERHPAFSSCGSGRKHPLDGGAWSAAIHDASIAFQRDIASQYGIVGPKGSDDKVGNVCPEWCVDRTEDDRPALGVRAAYLRWPDGAPPVKETWLIPQVVTELLIPLRWQLPIVWHCLNDCAEEETHYWADLFNELKALQLAALYKVTDPV